MKKGLVFVLGILTGFVITIVGLLVVAKVMNGHGDSNGGVKTARYPGLTLYEQPKGTVEGEYFKVMQVINIGALAQTGKKYGEDYSGGKIMYGDPIVLFLSDDANTYYDDQVIHVAKGSLQQIGTYKYSTRIGMKKTVPVVREP